MSLRLVLYIVAASQLVLGLLTTFVPGLLFGWMGLSPLPTDGGYMLAMLGARFVAYGIGMLWVARQQPPDRFWIANMIFIQAIDFAAGAAYLSAGVVTLSVVAFPMFNAAAFILLLYVFGLRRRSST